MGSSSSVQSKSKEAGISSKSSKSSKKYGENGGNEIEVEDIYEPIDFKVDKEGIDMNERTAVIDTLKKCQLFISGLYSDNVYRYFFNSMRREEVADKTFVIKQGQAGSRMYVLYSGTAHLFVNGYYDQKISGGSIFGEMVLYSNAKYQYTVRCGADCIIYSLHRDAYKEIEAAAEEEAHEKTSGGKASIANYKEGTFDAPAIGRGKFDYRKFDFIAAIGNGAFGVVYLAEYNVDSSLSVKGETGSMSMSMSVSSGADDASTEHSARDQNNNNSNNNHSNSNSNSNSNNVVGSPSGVSRRGSGGAIGKGVSSKSSKSGKSNKFGSMSSKEPRQRQYAVKTMHKKVVFDSEQIENVLFERMIMYSLSTPPGCPFIAKFYGTCQSPDQIYLVSEPLLNGDLWTILYESYGILNIDMAQIYLASIIIALDYIHSKGFVYRDLKPENIMIDDKGYLRIIDFGLSKKLPYYNENNVLIDRTFTVCGTPDYLAPEVIRRTGYDRRVDLWAVGVLLYEMLMGKTLFSQSKGEIGGDFQQLLAEVLEKHNKGDFNLEKDSLTEESISLITQLLSAEPNARYGPVPEGSELRPNLLLSHKFFLGLDINALNDGSLVPSFIPPPMCDFSHVAMHKHADVGPFYGDQTIFKDF